MTMLCLLLVQVSFSQSVIDPNDPVVQYNPNNPPTQPAWGTVGKWVYTPSVNWDASEYKAYIYKGMPFRIMFPKNYDATGATKYPMIIMWHGRGEAQVIYNNEKSLIHGGEKHRNAVRNGQFNGFVVYPQNQSGYFSPANFTHMHELIHNEFTQLHVDLNRISCHGLSAGGSGTWNSIIDYPKDYAAAAPMSAASTSFISEFNKIRQIPIWHSQGGLDNAPHPNTSQQLVNAAAGLGMDYTYTLYPNLGHGVWNTHYNEPDFFPFFLRANKTNPVVYFEKTEFCPGDVIEATMAVTAGFDGYEWRKNGVTIPGATSNSYHATSLGTYDVRIKRGTEWSYYSPMPVVLKMKDPTVTPPIKLANQSSSNTLPAPDGSTTVDLTVEGVYTDYAWKAAGSSTVLGTNAVFTATPGEYVVSVTEPFGCSSSNSPVHKVVNANGTNGPAAPVSPAAFAMSKTAIKVVWTDVPNPAYNETAYEIYRSETSGSNYEFLTLVNADSTKYIDEGLLSNTTYYYVVRAINNNAASAITAEVSAKTFADNTPPTTPYNLQVVTTSGSSVSLKWGSSYDDAGVDKYEVYKGNYRVAVTSDTTATVYGLTENQVYNFSVKARDHAGNRSAASNQVTAAATFAGLNYSYYHGTWSNLPDFNTLTPVKTGVSSNVDITVRTQDNNFGFKWEGYIDIPVAGTYTFETQSDDGSKVYIGGYAPAYQIVDNDGLHGNRYREGNYTFPAPGKYPIVITFFENGGGENMQLYWKNTAHGVGSRQLIPDNAFGSNFTMPCCKPAAPANLSATALSYKKIRISWEDSSSNETGFQIYRAASQGGNYTAIGIVNPNDTVYIDSAGLSPNTTYYYQVVALGQYGASHSASGVSETLGDINFGVGATDNRSGSGYIMFSQQNVHQRFTSPAPNGDNSDHVIAIVYDNGQWKYDNNSTLVNFTPLPTDLIIAQVNFSSDQISGYQGVNGFINGIEYGFASGDLTFAANVWNGGANNGEFTVGGTYFNRFVENLADATTLPLPAQPATPANLTATALSTTSMKVKWDDNSTNEEEFVIYRSLNNNLNYLPVATLGANAGDSVVYVDTNGLFPNTTYYYMVEVSNAGGADSSAEVSASTLNTMPEMTAVANVLMRHSKIENIQLFASDEDNDVISYSGANLPAFASLTDYGDGTALLQLTPAITDTNTYTGLVIRATDIHGGVDSSVFDLTVTNNYIPTLDSIINFVMNEGDSMSTMLAAMDSNGVHTLTWDDSELPSFITLSPNPDGTAMLTLKPGYADGGTYPGTNVIVRDDENAEVNRRFNVTVNEINPNQTIRVAYKHSLNAPAPWNNINSVAAAALNNTSGAASGITTQLMTSSWKSFNEGAQTGNNSGVAPDVVLKDYYYFGIFGAPNTIDLRLSGLKTGSTYNISFIASSAWTGTPNNGTTVFTANGQSASVYAHNNTSNTANLTGLTPNASGQLTVTMSKAADGTPTGYLNGYVLEEVYNYGAAPDAARQLTATFNNGSVNLNWYDSPYNETSYKVFRSDSLNGTYTQINAQPLAANSTSFSDPNVIQNNYYYYKVQAANSFGVSGFSNVAHTFITNTAPTLTISGDTTISVDSTGMVMITTTDPPNHDVTIQVSGLPAFAAYSDHGDGTASIVLTPSTFDIGEYPVEVTATDELNASTTKSFTISVTEALLYSVYINFNQYASAAGPAPWNNTGKAPQNNDLHSNLKDHNNVATAIDMQLVTAFGGTFNQGAQTGNNSGVVPDDVLEEYYWFGIFGAPNQTRIKISDLDNTKKYNFKFLGSSVFTGSGVTDNGHTNYTIGNQTVSLYVQNNTSNLAVINNVVANSSGEVFVDIAKGPGASVGYINAMIIEVLPGSAAAFDPTNLTADAVSGSEIELSWSDNSFDETGFEIQRSTTGNDIDFVTVATVAPNTDTYMDSALSKNVVYYYRVRGTRSTGYTEYTNVAYTGTVAYSVYININGAAAYDEVAPWNNLSFTPGNGQVFTGFANDAGLYTGMDMIWVTAMQGSNDWGATTGNNSGVVPDKVMKSFYFNDAFDPAGEIKLTGMSQEYTYNFHFFGSIVTGYDIHTNFTVDGQTVTNSQTDNTSEISSVYGITSDLNNEIDIKVQEAAGSKWAIFNAMIIEAVTAPEPPYSRKGAEGEKKDGIAIRYGISDPVVSLYPNPVADNYVNLDYDNASYGRINVIVTDITGRMISSQQFANDQLKGTLKINLSNTGADQGMYLVRVEFADGQVRTERLVKF